ncbi:hypothetical protein O2K51_10185 [Apibacter raozihei]|uniref:LIC_10190 family membrane protein n=1 Tax=Apibacter raozihei TaxID=2500547 RepID=UPI000FE40FC6|nr:hypothetical protein [Apibacter raozihei]
MLLEIIYFILIFISILGWGLWSLILFKFKSESIALTLISGLIFLAVVLSLSAFFVPLGLKLEVIMILISLIPYYSKWREVVHKLKALKLKFNFFIILGILFMIGSLYPFILDHFGYYIPTIDWLNELGIIKGMANIDWSIGQVSFFHILQAGLDDTIDPFCRLNIFVSFIYLLYAYERDSYKLLVFLPISFMFLQSPSPDLMIFLFSLITANELLYNKLSIQDYPFFLVLSTFLFIVKPITFWLPAWVFINYLMQKNRKYSYKYFLIPIFLISLYLVKNIYVSSLPFFPVTILKVSSFWMPDSRILDYSNQIAALLTYHTKFTLEEIQSFTLYQKLYYWFVLKHFSSVIHILIVLVIIAYVLYIFKVRKKSEIALGILIITKIILIFNFSGQYRFMLDGVFILLFVLITSINFNRKVALGLVYASALIFMVTFSFSVIQNLNPSFKIIGFRKENLWKPGKFILNKYERKKIGNLDINVSTDYSLNFDTPAPAFTLHKLNYYLNLGIFPQQIDSTDISRGIYSKPLSETEKIELLSILDNYKNGSK